jgi:indolepyruvate ferredoxin oxidoreductase alpha subunit
MSRRLTSCQAGEQTLLMGNEAIARGALEAGVNVVAGYPGTPSSEIVESLAEASEEGRLYVEWSVNEKVALEVAAAASCAELKAMCVMKQVGVNVAADTLLHVAQYGARGALVLVSCEDPGALSSTNEGDSRPYAKMMEFPLLEPGDFQEAKDMARWAFALSEEIRQVVMLRSVTRLSHASGKVVAGELPKAGTARAVFNFGGGLMDPLNGPFVALPPLVGPMRRRQHEKLARACEMFETSPFNRYSGPERPELLIVTSSACQLYAREAVDLLELRDRIGVLKLGTTWPLPPQLLTGQLERVERVLIVEEGTPFLEDNLKALAAELAGRVGIKKFFGKRDGTVPPVNELSPDAVVESLARLCGRSYTPVDEPYAQKAARIAAAGAPARELAFCPGCPHRASFWVIHTALQMDHRSGFVCGDIGCYSLAAAPTGFSVLKVLQAMGTGIGMAAGFGKLKQFGLDQPVLAVCGDSTFFHAAMPALVNAVHNRSDMTLVVLDNSGTAMTGFQPHPGIALDAAGRRLPALDIAGICRALGARVEVGDPFEIENSRETLLELLESADGLRVLILKQACALSPQKKSRRRYRMSIDPAVCLSESCGCNRLCTRVFKCPALIWDAARQKTAIDEVLCAGCGVCAAICPTGAIRAEEVAG